MGAVGATSAGLGPATSGRQDICVARTIKARNLGHTAWRTPPSPQTTSSANVARTREELQGRTRILRLGNRVFVFGKWGKMLTSDAGQWLLVGEGGELARREAE